MNCLNMSAQYGKTALDFAESFQRQVGTVSGSVVSHVTHLLPLQGVVALLQAAVREDTPKQD